MISRASPPAGRRKGGGCPRPQPVDHLLLLREAEPDIVCLQEIKALKENVEYQKIEDMGYHHHWFSAEKKGYSGVAIFTKIKPDNVEYGNRIHQSDLEGRVIRWKPKNSLPSTFTRGSSAYSSRAPP